MTPANVNARISGQPARGKCRPAAFTLIEVLLVIALLGLGAMLMVNGASDLIRTREPRPDEIFWEAVTSARQLALEGNQTVVFKYDKEKHALSWSAKPEANHTLAYPGYLLEFLPVIEQGTVLIGGQLTETTVLKRVRFYGDGGCDAFRAQLTDAKGHRATLAIDPWTCAPIIATTP